MRQRIQRWRSREIIFAAHLDYGYSARNEGRDLGTLLGSQRIEKETDLEGSIQLALTRDLPAELSRIYDVEVEVRVIEIRPGGSVEVFFGAIVAGLGVISSYSDLVDSIKLIRKHASAVLGRTLRRRLREDIDVSLEVQFPEIEEWDRRTLLRRIKGGFPGGEEIARLLELTPQTIVAPPRRDGFFWFLLVSTVLLFGIVAVLVGGAVVKTYF